jgi:hypothetical protein
VPSPVSVRTFSSAEDTQGFAFPSLDQPSFSTVAHIDKGVLVLQ